MLQVITSRADNVELIYRNDTKVAKFPNGTVFTFVEVGAMAGVTVECPGYATVKYCVIQSKCKMDFKDGFQIECDCSGSYLIHDNSKFHLSLSSQGEALYTLPSGSIYCLDYSGKEDILNIADSSGDNIVKVDLHGETHSTSNCSLNGELHRAFKSRIFIINSDNTGYELLDSTRMKEVINLAESEADTTIMQDIAIPGTSCRSTVIMKPRILNENEYLHAFLETVLWPYKGQKCFGESGVPGVHCPVESRGSHQLSCHQFLTFEPLTDQIRDTIIGARFIKQQLEPSKPQYLKDLWQTSIKTTSDFLVNHATRKVDVIGHEEVSHSINKDVFAQRGMKLQEIFLAIRKGFIPGYFNSDTENQQVPVLKTKTHPLLSDLTSNISCIGSNSTFENLHSVVLAQEAEAQPDVCNSSSVDSKLPCIEADYPHQLQVCQTQTARGDEVGMWPGNEI